MTASGAVLEALPTDPSFSSATYERTAWLLRSGVIGFLVLSGLGLTLGLVENPSESVSSLVSSDPLSGFVSVEAFLSALGALQANALIFLGVFVMVAVSIGRVLLATVAFHRGREWTLAGVCAVVVVLLLVGLVVVAPLVR